VLLLDSEWVRINPQASFWLDVAAFEQAYDRVRTVPGHHLDEQSAQTLRDAVKLYQGELLAGWYQDWCVYERERFQSMYLAMLDKLIAYCEVHYEYQAGLVYGEWALRYDRARERTHRRMMRLYCLAGNRTEALHQYQRCMAALKSELDVTPGERTVALYEQIREGHLPDMGATRLATFSPQGTAAALAQVLSRLQRLQMDLDQAQQQVQQDIQTMKTILRDHA
jgi:DNA-binding SARP family transcriptional activator